MDLKILEIAAHTENNKVLSHPTHSSKNKNRICGDEMEISLIIKNDVVVDIGYQCKSCVYCQASVSLLSRKIKEQSLNSIKEFLVNAEHTFDNDAPTLKNYWKDFNQILDKKNLARKECLLLPLRTVMKALNS